MKLSDAVMLGQSLVRFEPKLFLTDNCGCLIGAGFAAATGRRNAWLHEMQAMWPWLNGRFKVPEFFRMYFDVPHQSAYNIIGVLAFGIARGEYTLEQAVSWIQQNEPREEPTSCPETVQTSLETVEAL